MGKPVRRFFCVQKGVVKRDAPERGRQSAVPFTAPAPGRGACPVPAAVFQFFQIPGRRVIEDQFPAVALLEQFPLLRLYPGKLLVDSLILVVLRPHLPALGEDSDPALSLDDLSPQVIVTAVHISDFFMKLLHRLDAVCL